MARVGKVFGKVIYTLCIILAIWVFVSYLDVIFHNTPSGGYKYQTWNVFEIMLNNDVSRYGDCNTK